MTIEDIKYNLWVFFARKRINRKLKKLKQDLGDLSWHLGVEKMNEPELVEKYNEIKTAIYISEITLKGLSYTFSN